jgi:hypothetical protein
VKYNGVIPVTISSWYSGFDNQNSVIALQNQLLQPKGSLQRCLNLPCIQVDAAGKDGAGKLIGFAFFDKSMNPFVPSRAPQKVAECRTTPCVEKWSPVEGFDTTYGEWSACTYPPSVKATSWHQVQCSKHRTITKTYYEQNSCTYARRVLRTSTDTEVVSCDCPRVD